MILNSVYEIGTEKSSKFREFRKGGRDGWSKQANDPNSRKGGRTKEWVSFLSTIRIFFLTFLSEIGIVPRECGNPARRGILGKRGFMA